MSQPLVSVCIPTYNRAAALRRTLETLREQDYAPLEIVISDNASTDETAAVAQAAAAGDPRIRYTRHAASLGLYGNHNFCLDQARGEFVSFFHDHDERDPRLISAMVRFLQAHPQVGVVSADWDLIDEQGRQLGVREHRVAEVTPGLAYIERTLARGQSSIGIPGAVIRREALGALRFNEQGAIGFGDFVLWFQLAERWDIGHIAQRLWRWRQHPHSQSARTVVSLVTDYEDNLNAYCDGYAARHPGELQRVARWRHVIRRYLFWALAYEIGLQCRRQAAGAASATPTLFEILDYRLSPEEFDEALRRLKRYRTGLVERLAWLGIRGLVALRLTRPLAWATEHHVAVRALLRLR